MRVRELFENNNFKETDFIKKHGDKHELDYDLVDDLMHYMHNDDHVYRRHVFPVISKCIDRLKENKPTSSSMFAGAVKECYSKYRRKFPIRVLPDELDEETLKQICDKFHEDFNEHVRTGKYED